MAGQFTEKSSKSSFMNGSPKPKQASILNFFSSQKQQVSNSSPLAKISQKIDFESKNTDSTEESENIPPEFFEDSFDSNDSLKKKPNIEPSKPKIDFKSKCKNFNDSSTAAPRILADLNEAALADFEGIDSSSSGRYQWLIDIKDINGRKKGEEGYDGRTLFIPDSAWNKFTPFEKQFWEIKTKFFDTVVFFKKGKFFELYENDADIGSKEFNLKMTDRVNMRMVGVPEATFDFWAAKFVGKGYKVAKVDQLENAVSKTMREKSEKSKSEKIIRRELTSILTSGTLVDANHLKSDSANYCISFKITEIATSNELSIGAAFVDASSSKFFIVDFTDDSSFVVLATLLSQINPREIILEKGWQKSSAVKVIKTLCTSSSVVYQDPIKEFWDHVKTANELEARQYFGASSHLPDCLKLSFERQKNSFSAFGSLVSYLRVLKLDYDLLSYGDVSFYEIMKENSSMILDGQAIEHLSVCSPGPDQKNTLLGIIDRCNTPFGRRRLKLWLLYPLLKSTDIRERQESVSFLINNYDLLSEITRYLKTLPDLERLCTRVHACTLPIKSFVSVLNGFKSIQVLKDYISKNCSEIPELLMKLLSQIPELSGELDFFFHSFDHVIAQRDGILEMKPGSFPDLDAAKNNISEWEFKFNEYLKEQEQRLKFKPLKYKDIGKEIYQLEMPVHVNAPSDFMVLSKTKSVKRYWTPELRRMVNAYLEAKEILASTQESALAVLYKRFASSIISWKAAIDAAASLDCLASLSLFSRSIPEPRCLPNILNSNESVFKACSLRHPIVACFSPDHFVSNDIDLSSANDSERVMILTGANMGGKSTLLRQVGLTAILAQLGTFVPASNLIMTPFDRVFTRLGANDNIIGGESTFKVELSETSKILKFSTCKSLVIIDELGRGTSTFDGVSIAEAVLHYLISISKSCVLFSTHYNMICSAFDSNPNVGLFYLSCLVNEEKKNVTFLYKLVRGVSPKSYGIHVAHMAGIPVEIIESASKFAESNSHLGNIAVEPESISKISELILKSICAK